MPRGGRGSHSTSIPNAVTESAIQARKSFYCELCGKGYGRMNEFEAHESSYDHQHKKRFLEMKQMQKGSTNTEARRERERRQEEKAGLITIKPIKLGNGNNNDSKSSENPKKGFKSAFGSVDSASTTNATLGGQGFKKISETSGTAKYTLDGSKLGDGTSLAYESDTESEDYEHYSPAYPTQ